MRLLNSTFVWSALIAHTPDSVRDSAQANGDFSFRLSVSMPHSNFIFVGLLTAIGSKFANQFLKQTLGRDHTLDIRKALIAGQIERAWYTQVSAVAKPNLPCLGRIRIAC